MDIKIDPAAYTSERCNKHNRFYTIPGGVCEDCNADFIEAMKSWIPPTKEEVAAITQRQVEGLSKRMSKPELVDLTSRSARHNTGKVQLREVDPAFILGLGEVLTASRSRYEEGNWMKETKFSTPYESAQRHLLKFWAGEELDNDTNLDHLLHAATNLMFLYFHKRSGVGIDDRLFKKDKK